MYGSMNIKFKNSSFRSNTRELNLRRAMTRMKILMYSLLTPLSDRNKTWQCVKQNSTSPPENQFRLKSVQPIWSCCMQRTRHTDMTKKFSTFCYLYSKLAPQNNRTAFSVTVTHQNRNKWNPRYILVVRIAVGNSARIPTSHRTWQPECKATPHTTHFFQFLFHCFAVPCPLRNTEHVSSNTVDTIQVCKISGFAGSLTEQIWSNWWGFPLHSQGSRFECRPEDYPDWASSLYQDPPGECWDITSK